MLKKIVKQLLKEEIYNSFLKKEQEIYSQNISYNDYIKQIQPILPNDNNSIWLFNHHAAQLAWEENNIKKAKEHISLAVKNNTIGNMITFVLDFIFNNKGSKKELFNFIKTNIKNKIELDTALQLFNNSNYGGRLKQNLKENDSLKDINMDKLLNLFIKDPVNFIKIFDINNTILQQTTSIRLSLAFSKIRNDLYKNWDEIHKNLKASIDGIDVSNEIKELIYPTDVPELINDTSNFLKRIEKRVKARKDKALLNSDFRNPYGRISKTRLTPLDIINDFLKNPKTNFNYSQYEYARADLDLQLINLIKNDDLKLKTTTILSNNDIKSDLINIFKNGLKGEELFNAIDISSLRKFVNSFWSKNKKEIETKYNNAKNNGNNPILIKIIDKLKN